MLEAGLQGLQNLPSLNLLIGMLVGVGTLGGIVLRLGAEVVDWLRRPSVLVLLCAVVAGAPRFRSLDFPPETELDCFFFAAHRLVSRNNDLEVLATLLRSAVSLFLTSA